jgi:SAM-dependent methyltransferase
MNNEITLCILIASGYERADIPRLQHERLEFLLASIRESRGAYSFPDNVRILVCDDYSENKWAQEKCSGVCGKYRANYNVKPPPWSGPCGNYNFAVSQSETEMIAMLGDDQFCSPGWWKYMEYFIEHNPELKWGMLGWSVVFVEDLIRANYYQTKHEFYTHPDKMWTFSYNLLPREAIDNSWCNWNKPRFRGCCTGTAFIIKKSLWKKFGGFFEQLYQFDEDYGDNVWNITDYCCIQVPTPPIIHYGGACCWPPEKGAADIRWRKGWELRPFVPVKFEDRGRETAQKGFKSNIELDKLNFMPLVYKPIVGGELILDLGCGKNKRAKEAIGVDIIGKPVTDADLICNLGFQTLPLVDNSCRLVMAHDLLEHIPHTVWINEAGNMKRLQPTVQLFNEVYRVLRNDGLFETNTPVYPHEGLIQDPTHSSLWSPSTFQYFANNYYGLKEAYGHKSNFKIVSERWDDIHYHVVMRAVK